MPNAFAGFPKEMAPFFRGLKRNNRREWFQPRKDVFDLHVKGPMIELVEALNREFAKFASHYITDPKRAIFRIYRDTRFSPDKTPYKTHIAARFGLRGGDQIAVSGYYFSVSNEQIEIAGGIYHPSPDTTLRVRTYIVDHYEELRRILSNQTLRRRLGGLQGDELSRAPKGFDPNHPAIDLIKKKDWILDVELDASLATTPRLQSEIADRFRLMTPLIEFLNRPLAERPARKLRDYFS